MLRNPDPHRTIAWHVYPALLFAACVALGIVLATQLPSIPFVGWGGGVFFALLAAGYAQFRKKRALVSLRPAAVRGAVALAGVCLGGVLLAHHQAIPASHVAHQVLEGDDTPEIWLEGRILEEPTVGSSGTRLLLASSRFMAGTDTLAVEGKVSVFLGAGRFGKQDPFPAMRAGDVIQVTGKLRRIGPRRNPADFDYAAYQARRGVWVSMSLYEAAAAAVVDHQPSLLDRLVTPARTAVRTRIHRFILHDEARAIAQALLLGDRHALASDTREQFARTGLAHLLAVSGLHMLLVGMLFYRLLGPVLVRLRWIGLKLSWASRERIRALLTMALLLGYLLLAGASPSAMRAVIMAVLFIGGAVLQRTSNVLNTLGVAAVVILLLRPTQLFEVGFQLSFAAVGAIVTLYPVLEAWLPSRWITRGWRREVVSMVGVSLAASLGTLPVLLYHFGQASFAGVLLNVIAIPVTALTLGAAMLAVALAPVTSLAAVFGAAADVLAQFLLILTAWGDAWLGFANIVFHIVDNGWIAALVCFLIALVQWARPRLRWRFVALGGMCIVGSLWISVFSGVHQPDLEVVFFDVGHGDAALVSLPNGNHVLIDTGERSAFSDQGSRTILPHLERYGIDRLSAVVISHPHGDHLGGLPAILRGVPVGRVIHNGQLYDSDLFRETRMLLDSLQIPTQIAAAGDTLAWDPAVRTYVLGPATASEHADANDASVVLRMVYGQTAFLFTGDAEAEAEHALVERYGAFLQSEVVKVGHHGSRTSSTAAFVARVTGHEQPIAVVSVGRRSRFGLPNEEVMDRWQQNEAKVWTTAWGGALWLRSDGTNVERIRWR